ncbi:MAG TPA: NAD(P)-dependent oxidoreductase [Acidobacteriaceae bacterium]|nr:NAD(P)-dependent oxidoreductase [Acidobacteriaceae bacterium]
MPGESFADTGYLLLRRSAMKVVVMGGSGMIGSRVVRELSERGHTVTAVARNPSRIQALPGVTAVAADLHDAERMAAILPGADAVVSAISPPKGQESEIIPASEGLLRAAHEAGVRRVLIVGGAASLLVAPGVALLDTGHLPKEWMPIATAHRDLLQRLRTTDLAKDMDWTCFSPAAFIQPGERTGKFRPGKDELVADAQGQSRISAEDYAVALVNELEHPQHVGQRFTIGY